MIAVATPLVEVTLVAATREPAAPLPTIAMTTEAVGKSHQRQRPSSLRFFSMLTPCYSSQAAADKEEEAARNPGSNLFVTGIHPRLSEEDVTQLFEKYGEVEKANIMRDPHSGDSRGFGFVKMVTPEQADAAREGLHGLLHEGRTLSIEKARRAKPRTPTPGKYYGPPKRGKYISRPSSLRLSLNIV
jgi:RNA recognition motif-containing protein